jgi:hypothetical protein
MSLMEHRFPKAARNTAAGPARKCGMTALLFPWGKNISKCALTDSDDNLSSLYGLSDLTLRSLIRAEESYAASG